MLRATQLAYGGAAPATRRSTALPPEWRPSGAAYAAPAIPAAESALGSHPCVALIVAPKERCLMNGFSTVVAAARCGNLAVVRG